jgi:hypothetical protein
MFRLKVEQKAQTRESLENPFMQKQLLSLGPEMGMDLVCLENRRKVKVAEQSGSERFGLGQRRTEFCLRRCAVTSSERLRKDS